MNIPTPPTVSPRDKQPLTIRQQLESANFHNAVAKALPKHLAPDRFIRVAITAMTKTPKLAQCDQASFFGALLTLSQLGLEPDGRRAHLIPFENRKRGVTEVQLIVDYKGLVELALRAGNVSNIHADKVCENDIFEVDRGQIVKHTIDYRKPRGDAYAFYCLIRFKDGGEKAEVMTREEVDSIRSRSRAGQSGPWVTDYDEMGKKTVFRRCSKWITLSPEIVDALDADADTVVEAKTAPKAAAFEGSFLDVPSTGASQDEERNPVPVKEDDGDLAPAPRKQPDQEKAPVTPITGKTATYLKGTRNLCKMDKISEAKLITYMRETGLIDDSLSSLDEIAENKPSALETVFNDWSQAGGPQEMLKE